MHVLIGMPPPKYNTELPSVLGIMNYHSKDSLTTSEICEPVRVLTSVKTEWSQDGTYQKLCDNFVKKNGVFLWKKTSLGTVLFQVEGMTCPRDKTLENPILRAIAFASKSLFHAES